MITFSILISISFTGSLSVISHWLLALTSLEIRSSVFSTTHENSSFWISAPTYCGPSPTTDGAQIMEKRNELSEPNSQNDIGLHVTEF